MVKVSVIVPIYNVRTYLRRSINSILSQTLSDIEIILVDDGSTDGSSKIIDNFVKMDNRVIAIHQRNSGAPVARNMGILKSRGKYLYFMDPDDWIEKGLIYDMYSFAEKCKSELVITGFNNIYQLGNKKFVTRTIPEMSIYNNENEFRKNAYRYFNNSLMAVPWNKLYLSSYIKQSRIEFPNVKWDDLHFNMEVIKNIERVSILPEAKYNFLRYREGSETTKVFDYDLYDRRKEQFKHILLVYNKWNINDKKSMETIYYYYNTRIVQCIQEITNTKKYSYGLKKSNIKRIMSDPLTIRALKLGKGSSLSINICLLPLKFNNAMLALLFGSCISFFKNHFKKTFFVLKIKIMNS